MSGWVKGMSGEARRAYNEYHRLDMARRRRAAVLRFEDFSKDLVRLENGCWMYEGIGFMRMVRWKLYDRFVAPLLPDDVLKNTCGTKCCVNPKHQEIRVSK